MPRTAQTNGQSEPAFDFNSVIDESVDAWPEPTPLTAGFWSFSAKSGKLDKAKGRVIIALQPTAPMGETDASGIDLANSTVFATFNMTRHDDVARLKALIKAINLGQYNISDALKAIKGAALAGEVTHSPRDDGTDGVYVNVRRLGPMVA